MSGTRRSQGMRREGKSLAEEGWIRQVRIRWTEPHHPMDGDRIIDSFLEAGGDEGPLIALSAEAGRGPARRQVAWVFENVLWYKAHLEEHGSELPGERWVGIAHWSDRGPAAEAAIRNLQRLVGPEPRRPRGRLAVPDLSYGTLKNEIELTEPVLLQHEGEPFKEVQSVYPMLRGLMILLPSGIVDYGVDVEIFT